MLIGQGFKRSGRLNDDAEPDFRRRQSSLNTGNKHETGIHVWVFRISILVAILLLISFYFIPFPVNLILFIISLVVFLVISFWVHIRMKRQTMQDSANIYYPSNRLSTAEQTFVDVPLEPIAIADNGMNPNAKFNRI